MKFFAILFLFIALIANTLGMATTVGVVSDDGTIRLTPQQWREDLHFFANEMEKRHKNPFHYTSKEKFEAEVARLDQDIDKLNGDEIFVRLQRLASMIGDGHTYVQLPKEAVRNFPLGLRRFGHDFRVARVGPGLEKALGTRVLSIQNTPISDVEKLLLPLTPQDETPWYCRAQVAQFATWGNMLHGSGIITDHDNARFTLVDDSGQEFTTEFHAVTGDEFANIEWIRPYQQPPLYLQNLKETFWFTYLPDARTIYCEFRGYNDLGKYSDELFKLIKEKQPDKLVIDMRQNGGGDYTKGLKYLVNPIRENPGINKKGHLFILIGSSTFSAAMSNSAHFRFQTNAMLVGEPIGEKPNSYQEPRNLTMPNSHCVFQYQTQFYKFVESGENVIKPDQEIILSWEDFKAGRDPVLDWVLKH